MNTRPPCPNCTSKLQLVRLTRTKKRYWRCYNQKCCTRVSLSNEESVFLELTNYKYPGGADEKLY